MPVPCPICESPRFGKIVQVNAPSRMLDYMLCADCGMVFHTRIHPDDYYAGAQYRLDEGQKDEVSDWDIEQQNIRADLLVPILDSYRGSVLDVGCSAGILLERFLLRGQEVMGIEPSATFRAHARARGLDVCASIDDIPSGKTFSLATIIHVLEHLTFPMAMLKKLLGMANVLCVVVPSLDFDPTPFAFSHPCLFTPDTLRRALELSGWCPQVVIPFHGYKNVARKLPYPVDILAMAVRYEHNPVGHIFPTMLLGHRLNGGK